MSTQNQPLASYLFNAVHNYCRDSQLTHRVIYAQEHPIESTTNEQGAVVDLYGTLQMDIPAGSHDQVQVNEDGIFIMNPSAEESEADHVSWGSVLLCEIIGKNDDVIFSVDLAVA